MEWEKSLIADLVLDVTAVPASRPRVRKNGWTYYPKKHEVTKELYISALKELGSHRISTGALHVEIIYVLRRPKSAPKRLFPVTRPDIDNYDKMLLDCCTGLLWVDDSQIVSKHSQKVYGEPCIKVKVYEFTAR